MGMIRIFKMAVSMMLVIWLMLSTMRRTTWIVMGGDYGEPYVRDDSAYAARVDAL